MSASEYGGDGPPQRRLGVFYARIGDGIYTTRAFRLRDGAGVVTASVLHSGQSMLFWDRWDSMHVTFVVGPRPVENAFVAPNQAVLILRDGRRVTASGVVYHQERMTSIRVSCQAPQPADAIEGLGAPREAR